MLRRRVSIVCCSLLLIAAAPQVVIDGEPTGVTQDELRLVSFDCRPETLAPDLARICRVARRLGGLRQGAVQHRDAPVAAAAVSGRGRQHDVE